MKLNKNKSVNSILNGISSIIYTVVNGLLSLVVTKIVLDNYGSDYNGLNAAATQVINMLLILESGFTIASNVALFAPLQREDNEQVSRIVSATRSAFIRIGMLYFIIGSVVMTVYAFVVSSELPQQEIVFIMLISLIPTGITFLFSTKYQVLLQATQHEYIVNCIKTIAYLIGQLLVILVASCQISRIGLRVVMLVSPILMAIILTLVGRNLFSHINMKMKADYSLIKGTRELLVQKFVGLIYSTAPYMIMSIRIGTKAISIYAVYTNVTTLLKSVANAMLNAPRMSLGALIAEGKQDRIRSIFSKYELIVFSSSTVMVSTYFALILPFVKIYTANVTDVVYTDTILATLLGITFFIECLHIPSGIYITMSGNFKVAQQIQVFGAVILGMGIAAATIHSTLHGFVFAVLVAAVALASMEMGYVHSKCLHNVGHSVRQILLYGAISVLLSAAEYALMPQVHSFLMLIVMAVAVFCINVVCVCAVGLLFYKSDFISLLYMAGNFFRFLKRQ